MNLRDLKYLVTVAEIRHFGKAAAVCNVSQPTLSMQIKKLEESLGAKLIERSNKKMLLTETGEAVVAAAREILNACEQMQHIAKSGADPFSGEITLGAFPTLAPYLLPLVMPAIKKSFPKLSVNLLEEKTAVLLEQLESGKIDCALIALPIHSHNIETKILFEEPFYLAVPNAHALAKSKKISVSDLDGHTLLLLDEGHCLRDQALEVCQKIGAQESQNFRATSLETLRQMVASGSAATLMPKLAIHKQTGITYVPFAKPPRRVIALCYRKSTAREKLMEALAKTIAAKTQLVL